MIAGSRRVVWTGVRRAPTRILDGRTASPAVDAVLDAVEEQPYWDRRRQIENEDEWVQNDPLRPFRSHLANLSRGSGQSPWSSFENTARWPSARPLVAQGPVEAKSREEPSRVSGFVI